MSDSLPIVVYVSRFQDEDSAGKFARFVDSCKKHPAGHEHDLFIIKKGFQEHEDVWDTWIRQLDGIPFQIRAYPDRHFVFGYVRNLMEEFPDRYILICNATCEIRVDQWLDLFMCHANPNRILGAMGSYRSMIFPPPLTLRNFIRSSGKTRHAWWLSLWGNRRTFWSENFYPYPNPHLRTAVFMVPPRLLERWFYWPRSESILSKNDEFLFESGKFSMTVQALLAGLEPLVVGVDGKAYPIVEWPHAETFQSGEQKNLVISDHQARTYDAYSFERKKRTAKGIWKSEIDQLDRFFEQVMSSDTSQIETFFLKAANRHDA